jgi:hypothetical protein
MYGIQNPEPPLPQPSFPTCTLKIQFNTGLSWQTGWFINYEGALEGIVVNLIECCVTVKSEV